ncbi:MAG: DUF6325 family protein [Acidimicrobiales bacterium]
MTIGPVNYLVVGFPGNKFNGEIAPALGQLVDDGLIRILDLVFVGKDTDGDVTVFEYDEHDDLVLFAEIDAEVGGLANDEDIDRVGGLLEPGNSAALLIWEDLWAAPLAEAMRNSGGIALEGARIPHELIQSALSELDAAG